MWKVTVGGEEIREGDLTLGQAEQIEELAGLTWRAMNPLHSAKVAVAIVSVVTADRQGIPVAEAKLKAAALPVSEVFDSFGTYDDLPVEYDEGFPSAEGEPPTST